ncbi:DNA polymerase II [Marinagarivorans algicola]|uniref:DNA polymerase II n=1 Tax=Marinagarivorans algicola TaxID=1513270 RepID=UPI0006B9C505|nr:DNA polymerase II [Marinagarivorans algicola]
MQAFLLTRQWHDTPQGITLELWCTCATPTAKKPPPHALRILITQQEAVFFVQQKDLTRIAQLLTDNRSTQNNSANNSYRTGTKVFKNDQNTPVVPLYFLSYRAARDNEARLTQHNIPVWEADIRPPERYLMERFITGGLTIEGPSRTYTDHIEYYNPKLNPLIFTPQLRSLSVDIETSMDAQQLYSITAYNHEAQHVFMVNHTTAHDSSDADTDTDTDTENINNHIHYLPSEHACLGAFLHFIQHYNPDCLIGWNFIQFDLKVLKALCQKHKVAFNLGRAQQPIKWREDKSTNRYYITIPGRLALDGIELLKAATYNFASFKLDNVAQELLGERKLIENNPLNSQQGGQTITTLYKTNQQQLAKYNLQDCKLVWDIFAKTKLFEFAIVRSQLTGLLMDRMGGSVAAFEFSYLPKLHRKGYIAPNLGELQSSIISPGGYVLDSQPGIYSNVLVLDFKSLYPSIIRTFHIDPYAYWYAQHQQLSPSVTIPGFNNAYFSKEEHLLPTIIKELWQARDQAKANNDQPLSQAIKIIMNSFYGVLGSTGCRFFDPRICSSITLRGHQIIQQTKHWIEQNGSQVIYGDTDSVFVWVGNDKTEEQALAIGTTLAAGLNQYWQNVLRSEYDIPCALEIEFETLYLQFLMPTIRNSSQGSKKRYAGVVHHDGQKKIIFKGLENVRTDWTALAKNFQLALYTKVFNNEPVEQYINDTVQNVLKGNMDEQLIYRKRLRRNLEDYQKNIPPHVQAAHKLARQYTQQTTAYDWQPPPQKGDWIEYLLTVNGPEPIAQNKNIPTSPIAYDQYIERQLKPIADSVLQFIGLSFDSITTTQMGLF